MVPALASIKGYKSAEIVVQHHPRKHGVSKYGIERFLRGFMDMITVGFLRRYRERPSALLRRRGGGLRLCRARGVRFRGPRRDLHGVPPDGGRRGPSPGSS